MMKWTVCAGLLVLSMAQTGAAEAKAYRGAEIYTP